VQDWIRKVKGIQAEGGTALFAGLEMAYQRLDEDRTSGIILVTDGVCNVGPTEHAAFLKLCRSYDLRLFTFVIGNSANQPLMEALALDSQGFAMNLSDADDMVGRLIQAKAKVLYECLHDVKVTFSGEKVRDLTPARPGSLYQGQQLVQFGRYDGDGPVEVTLSAKISGQERVWKTRAVLPAADAANPELERLWALSRIEELMQQVREHGESETLRGKVTELGVDYSLVTDYTSMVVLRDEVAEAWACSGATSSA
jgi:Ca-activated chloride channel family protein